MKGINCFAFMCSTLLGPLKQSPSPTVVAESQSGCRNIQEPISKKLQEGARWTIFTWKVDAWILSIMTYIFMVWTDRNWPQPWFSLHLNESTQFRPLNVLITQARKIPWLSDFYGKKIPVITHVRCHFSSGDVESCFSSEYMILVWWKYCL